MGKTYVGWQVLNQNYCDNYCNMWQEKHKTGNYITERTSINIHNCASHFLYIYNISSDQMEYTLYCPYTFFPHKKELPYCCCVHLCMWQIKPLKLKKLFFTLSGAVVSVLGQFPVQCSEGGTFSISRTTLHDHRYPQWATAFLRVSSSQVGE